MMTDTERRIDAYTSPLHEVLHINIVQPQEVYNIPLDTQCQVFGNKFVAGNQPADGVLPLAVALMEPWETDCHLVQYVADPAVRCTKGHAASYDLEFACCMFDVDFAGHKRLPDLDDFADLLLKLWVLDVGESMPVPNVVYMTRGGARLVYLIEPCTDPEWFESHCDALRTKIDKALSLNPGGWAVDMACKDWGRLFRAARVTRDGDREFGRPIRVFHSDKLDLDGFRVKPKPERKVMTGDMPYDAGDMYLLRTLSEITEGSRNQAVFKAICHINRKYETAAAEKWINTIHAKAINSGLDDREFETILRSAENQKRENA